MKACIFQTETILNNGIVQSLKEQSFNWQVLPIRRWLSGHLMRKLQAVKRRQNVS